MRGMRSAVPQKVLGKEPVGAREGCEERGGEEAVTGRWSRSRSQTREEDGSLVVRDGVRERKETGKSVANPKQG